MAEEGTRRKKSRREGMQREGNRRKCVANPRECMAKAFQLHLQTIIENTIFSDSNLPDIMISNGALTEDECCHIRERPNRKDQIRTLMVIVRGRSLKYLECLLNYFKQENKKLANEIHNCYKDLINEGYRDNDCIRCKLKTDVDVKSVADRLHTKDVISKKLYNEIVMTEAPVGGQDKLWDKLITSLESNIEPKNAFNCFKTCLSEKGHYSHLADDMGYFLVQERKMLECICNVPLRPRSIGSSKFSNSDSAEPLSSDSRGSTHSVELRSILMETVSPRPEAMYFTPECLKDASLLEFDGDVELRQCNLRRKNGRPKALYITQQREGRFFAEMILEADPRVTSV